MNYFSPFVTNFCVIYTLWAWKFILYFVGFSCTRIFHVIIIWRLALDNYGELHFLQPFGQTPVVEDGDFRLFESRAIIRYYAAKYADRGPDLLGTTLEERALVEQWLEVEAHNFNDLCFTMMLQLVILPRMGKPGNLALAHSCEQELGKVLDVYERRLSESTYLAGDNFSLADLSHLPGLGHLIEEANMGHLVAERKKVNAWWEKISSRPAWKKLKDLAQ
ncbi:Glutathione S-transferase F11 [Spatholobus suberectus]|nr:Glutathione S-transferase F11 [Spatholobus suberectus]